MGLLKCRDISDKASSFFDGELGSMMRLRFRAHLVICPPCSRYYKQLEAVIHATRLLGDEDADHDVHDVVESLMQRLEQTR